MSEAPEALRGQLQGPSADQDCALGAFRVRWHAKPPRLEVIDDAAPERVLWQSPSDQPFLFCARGSAAITESRGFFRVADDLSARSAGQSVETIEADGEGWRLRGRLLSTR